MDSRLDEFITVQIAEDRMQATIYLSSTMTVDGTNPIDLYTTDSINQFLFQHGIKAGIDRGMLQAIVTNKLFDRPVVIARGLAPLPGEDGFFTYNFDATVDSHPKILPDGSVDYKNISNYAPVNMGEEIITYTPATGGHFGYTVTGEILQTIHGKDKVVIHGSGFTISEDKKHYYSKYNGKIEVEPDGSVVISNILDIKGDVDIKTGNIDFNGDVIISGSVLSGSSIKVSGNVSILGNVEDAQIIAGGNVELKSGMQGGGRGYVQCGGELWGKFFEQTSISCQGDLHANSMMNCSVTCSGNVYVSGRHGCIVGGTVHAQGVIEATVIGNLAEVITNLSVGVNESMLSDLADIEKKIKEKTEEINKHSLVKEKLDTIVHPVDPEKYEEMYNHVISSMTELGNQLKVLQEELDQKLFLISTYSQSYVKVDKYMYPNVISNVNGLHYTTTATLTAVTIKCINNEIHVVANR